MKYIEVTYLPGTPKHLLCEMYYWYEKSQACSRRGQYLARRYPRKDRMAFSNKTGKWRHITSHFHDANRANKMFGRLCQRLEPWSVRVEKEGSPL